MTSFPDNLKQGIAHFYVKSVFFFKLKKLSTKIYFSLEICALISRVWEISFRYCFYLSAFKVQNQKQLDVFRTLTDHFQFINVYFWLSCCSELLFFCKQSWIYLSKGPYFPKYKSLFWKKIHQAWHSAVFTINTIFTSNLCPLPPLMHIKLDASPKMTPYLTL